MQAAAEAQMGGVGEERQDCEAEGGANVGLPKGLVNLAEVGCYAGVVPVTSAPVIRHAK